MSWFGSWCKGLWHTLASYNSIMSLKLSVKVIPNAKKNEVIEDTIDLFGHRHLKVKVNALPENGKANQALLEILAKFLTVKKKQLVIVSGVTSRNKIVEVRPSE